MNIKLTSLLAVCVTGLAVSASAQSTTTAVSSAPPNPAVAGNYGLLGGTYSEVDFGYVRQDEAPKVSHDYDFVYNQSLLKTTTWGLDGNVTYDYLSASAFGDHDYRNDVMGGVTAYLWQGWGKPFVTADAGQAWDRVAGIDRNSFAYSFTGGVEFQLAPDLVLTPFAEYEAEPRLYNRSAGIADFPDHDWDYGVKATYRLTPQWGVSLAAAMDQYNRNDLGYRAGLSYHF